MSLQEQLQMQILKLSQMLQGTEYEQEFLKLIAILYKYQLENIRVLEGLLDSSQNNSLSDLQNKRW